MKPVLTALTLTLATATAPAWADCPRAPDIEPALDALIDKVRKAQTEAQARLHGPAFWALWAKAPDAKAQGMLDRGMALLQAGRFNRAEWELNALIDYCPDYAEGYNQRAFVNYLRQDFEAALPDLDRALELQPKHIAALSGKALTLFGMGRTILAREVLQEALRMNPWLSERRLLGNPGVEL